MRSKGVATFNQIDAHIKATATKHIAGGSCAVSQALQVGCDLRAMPHITDHTPLLACATSAPSLPDAPADRRATPWPQCPCLQ